MTVTKTQKSQYILDIERDARKRGVRMSKAWRMASKTQGGLIINDPAILD